jgi:hypothetical protein
VTHDGHCPQIAAEIGVLFKVVDRSYFNLTVN